MIVVIEGYNSWLAVRLCRRFWHYRSYTVRTKVQNPRHLACACSPVNGHTYPRAPWIARSGIRPTYARARWIARVSFFACFHAISLERSRFGKMRHITIDLLVVHNPMVPLIGRLVACTARTRADRQTDRTTTVTLAANARRGLIISPNDCGWVAVVGSAVRLCRRL